MNNKRSENLTATEQFESRFTVCALRCTHVPYFNTFFASRQRPAWTAQRVPPLQGTQKVVCRAAFVELGMWFSAKLLNQTGWRGRQHTVPASDVRPSLTVYARWDRLKRPGGTSSTCLFVSLPRRAKVPLSQAAAADSGGRFLESS